MDEKKILEANKLDREDNMVGNKNKYYRNIHKLLKEKLKWLNRSKFKKLSKELKFGFYKIKSIQKN